MWRFNRWFLPKTAFPCCTKFKLGGNLSPDHFKINQNNNNCNIEEDAITIIEDDTICIKGLSYDKNRFMTLCQQMKTRRRVFFSLGLSFMVLSIPTSICIMYLSQVITSISPRVEGIEVRMDYVRQTMELLESKRNDLLSMSQDLVSTLSSVTYEPCWQSSDELFDMSTDVIESMRRIDLTQDDISQVKDSVINASGKILASFWYMKIYIDTYI